MYCSLIVAFKVDTTKDTTGTAAGTNQLIDSNGVGELLLWESNLSYRSHAYYCIAILIQSAYKSKKKLVFKTKFLIFLKKK